MNKLVEDLIQIFRDYHEEVNRHDWILIGVSGDKRRECVEKLLENDYYKRLHLVEVMNCEGGCISGSGQPLCQIGEIKNIIDKRKASNKLIDKKSKERCSYENKEMMKLYKEYLKNPLSERCINMLHTSFTDKSNLLKQD